MEILSFEKLNNALKEVYLSQIESANWVQAKELADHLKNGSLTGARGEHELLLLVENKELCAFLLYADMSNVQPTSLEKWICFLYTFEAYRGKRLIGKLVDEAKKKSKEEGYNTLFVSTPFVGLYEKYGFSHYQDALTLRGEPTKIYKLDLN